MRSKKLENVFKQKGSQYRNKEDKKNDIQHFCNLKILVSKKFKKLISKKN